MSALLRTVDLSIAYQRDRPVLHDVNLAFEAGEFTGIVGPSGSGKTTLLRVLMGAIAPPKRQGRGQDLWQGQIERRPGLRLAYVPQLETINWDFPVTVFECVLMGRPQHGAHMRATPTERAEVMSALDRLGIAHLAGRHIRELSGGQQQRMFLARALTSQPELLLLDEPTSGVDITTRHAVLHLLADLNASGIGIVLTTHDLNGMAAHLPNLVCLNQRVVAEGHPADVLTAPVLEATFGAGLDVLTHLGMPVVVDSGSGLTQGVQTMTDLLAAMLDPFSYQFFVKGIIVATISGALLGLLGVYIVLRGMSYIGHGLSHAIFGGFAASQLIASSWYMLGAGIWGVASALAINSVARRHRIGSDAAIGVVTTASFALGVALLAKFGNRGPSFDAALFGSILGISQGQVWALIAISAVTVVLGVLGYRALLFATFDPDVAQASGVNVARTDAIFVSILSLAILATLTVIGVTLVAAMLVIPAVTARLLTQSFQRMLVLSTIIGSICGGLGMYASYFANVPSGTMIVLIAAGGFLIALGLGPAARRREASSAEAAAGLVPGPVRA